jgi:hypothetical protein
LEETGVRTEFVSLLCLREKHGYLWGRTDLYFVLRMRPVAGTEIRIDEREIAAAQWMDLDEFYRLPSTYATQKGGPQPRPHTRGRRAPPLLTSAAVLQRSGASSRRAWSCRTTPTGCGPTSRASSSRPSARGRHR